jgi:DNA-binding transcriptional MocR family regulator
MHWIQKSGAMKRYEALAELIAADIRNGKLPPGTRLPSVRKIRRQHQVSASTIFEAYHRLEDRGLVRARERSGYFVLGNGVALLTEPQISIVAPQPAAVDMSQLVFSILGAVQDKAILPLGSAFPSPELFPLARLAKSLASSARQIDPWDTVASLPPGNPTLRQQIALRYVGMGMPQPADNIIVTNGALEGLNLCFERGGTARRLNRN